MFENYVFLLGYERVVVLNDIETIREALSKSTDFAGKSAFSYFVDQFSMGFRGIISPNYSKKLMFTRKLAIKSMHLFGDGLKDIENIAIGRCDKIIERTERLNGKPLNVYDELGKYFIEVYYFFVNGFMADLIRSQAWN